MDRGTMFLMGQSLVDGRTVVISLPGQMRSTATHRYQHEEEDEQVICSAPRQPLQARRPLGKPRLRRRYGGR